MYKIFDGLSTNQSAVSKRSQTTSCKDIYSGKEQKCAETDQKIIIPSTHYMPYIKNFDTFT